MNNNFEGNIFNNPFIESAKKAMNPKDIEKYKLLGESMYKNIDFENNTIEQCIEDSVKKLEVAIKSGLHPSMLTDDEKTILNSELGNTWYEKFGYKKEDLTDFHTF